MAGKHTINISVLADTKKFASSMRNLGKETGLSKLGDMAKNAGKKVVGFFKSGIKWATAFAAATLATALFKGWNRLTSIENAQKQLEALGYTGAQVDGIMDDVLESVRGTAFGLDEAAGLANAALAAGIAPGADLAKELTHVADAAAFANVDLNRMGSILGKSAGGLRVNMGQLNQLRDAGLPALSMLADAYDLTAAEMEAMVSRGEISGDDLRRVLENNIGGAAQNMGDTTQGAFANMGAALGRFGAVLLDKVFPMIGDAFRGITDWLDTMTDRAEPIGEIVADAFGRAQQAVQDLAGWFKRDLLPVLKEVWEIVKGAFLQAVQTVKDALDEAGFSAGKAGDGIKNGIVSALQTLGPILAGVITGIASFTVWVIQNREMLADLAVIVGSVIAAWAAYAKTMAIVKAVTAVVNAVMMANPIGLIIIAVVALVAAFVVLWNRFEGFREFWLNGWEKIKQVAEDIVNWFKSVPGWFKDQFDRVSNFFNQFRTSWGNVWNGIKALVTGAWNAVRTTIQNGVDRVRAILNVIGDFIRSFLKNPIATMRNLFTSFGTTMANLSSNLWNRVKNAFISGVGDAIRSVSELPSRASQALSNAPTALLNAGRQIIDGFIQGLTAGFQRVRDTLGSLTNLLPSWKGPASRDVKLLTGAGSLIIDGLIDGMESEYSAVERSLKGLTTDIGRTDLGTIDGPAITPGAYASQFHRGARRVAPAGERQYHFHNHGVMTGAEAGREFKKAIQEYDRMNGTRP